MMTHFVCSKVFSRANICCPENEFLVTRSDDQDDVGGHDDDQNDVSGLHDHHVHGWYDYGHDLYIMLMPTAWVCLYVTKIHHFARNTFFCM